MRRRSDRLPHSSRKGSLLQKQVSILLCSMFLAVVGICPQTLFGQYKKLSVTASVGYSSLNLGEVDDKNQSDAAGWAAQGLPLSQFASLKQSPFYKAGVSYRFEREFGFSLSWSYWRKTVSASYNGPDATLFLERGVGSSDYTLGVAYYPDYQFSFLEWYFRTDIDLEFARATASAVEIRTLTIQGTFLPTPLTETDALYKKTKTAFGLTLGADLRIIQHVFLKGEATYRFAQLGTMEGTVYQFGVPSVETSSINFDFSGILLSTGLRIEL